MLRFMLKNIFAVQALLGSADFNSHLALSAKGSARIIGSVIRVRGAI